MLLEFSVANFRSVQGLQTLDLRATGLKSEDPETDMRNIVRTGSESILKVIGIYGPNGSGKSNLLNALAAFCRIIRHSLATEGYNKEYAQPFELSEKSVMEPVYFQATIYLSQKRYRYGFTFNRSGVIVQEWLFGPADKNETFYFKRTRGDVQVNEQFFSEGKELPLEKLREDALYLNFVSAFSGDISSSVRQFFTSYIVFDLLNARNRVNVRRDGTIFRGSLSDNIITNDLLSEGKDDIVLDWLRKGGLNYRTIKYDEEANEVLLYKDHYDESGNVSGQTEMNLMVNESAGTRKFYGYIGRLNLRFQNGGVFVVDEIDNNFHPFLLIQLIRLFNDPAYNKAGAQLIFTSHDTNLLQPELLRRDQIYFTEKSSMENTVLYSLADLKGIRNNADFARQYLAGFYGALPMLEGMREEKNIPPSTNLKNKS